MKSWVYSMKFGWIGSWDSNEAAHAAARELYPPGTYLVMTEQEREMVLDDFTRKLL